MKKGRILSVVNETVEKTYLSMKGEILLSDRNRCQFYSVWSGGEYKREMPIILFP